MASVRDPQIYIDNDYIFTGLNFEAAQEKLGKSATKKWLVRQSDMNLSLLSFDYQITVNDHVSYASIRLAMVNEEIVDVTENSDLERVEKTLTPVYTIKNPNQLVKPLVTFMKNKIFPIIGLGTSDGLSPVIFRLDKTEIPNPPPAQTSENYNDVFVTNNHANQNNDSGKNTSNSEEEVNVSSSPSIIVNFKSSNLANSKHRFTFDIPTKKPTPDDRKPPKPH